MTEQDESKFIVSVIKELLNLTERTSGKANKAQVATNIMYVVSRFPRFLCGHWAFLKTVVKKLNEFMHEKHPGVQDMASQTFLTISELTKQMFVQIQRNEIRPYIYDLIEQIPENMRDLSNNHRVMVYHGMGHMVSAASND
jgi:exportin-1